MKTLITFLLVLIQTTAFNQTIQTTLALGWGNSMVQSSDGGYVITGWQGPSVLLTKADSSGQMQWSKNYGDLFGLHPENVGYDIIGLDDGGFLITGHYYPSTSINGAYFIRTDQYGDTIWTRHYVSPFMSTDIYYGYKVRQNSFGEFIAAGQIEYDSTQPFDVVLMKLDSMGNLIWRKELDLGKKETFKDLEITDTGYVLIGESYIPNSPVHDHFILRTDTSGIVNFSRLYSQSPCCDLLSDLIINQNQNYVVVGYHNDSTTSYIDFFEFDSLGDTVTYNSISNPLQVPISGFFKHTNGYVLYGYKRTGLVDDALVLKVDDTGNEIWRKLYGGNNNDEFYSGLLTSNGLFAFAGSSNSFGPTSVYLVVTDTTGSVVSNFSSVDAEEKFIHLKFNNGELEIICENILCGSFDITLYDLTGKKIVNHFGNTINIKGLSSGLYIVVLADEKNQRKFRSKLFITNKI